MQDWLLLVDLGEVGVDELLHQLGRRQSEREARRPTAMREHILHKGETLIGMHNLPATVVVEELGAQSWTSRGSSEALKTGWGTRVSMIAT